MLKLIPRPVPSGSSATQDALAVLMRRVADHDRDAFAELYLATSAKLFGVVLRIVRDRAKAEDILQDVYMKIWERAGEFSSKRGAPSAWLTVIARNKAIDEVRSRLHLVPSSDMPGFDDLAAEEMHPLQPLMDQQDGQKLADCLDELEEQKKQMVALAYQQGLSRDELAAKFSIPVSTVKTWLRRSLEALRLCMGGRDGAE